MDERCGAKGCKARYACASCASMHLLTLSPANAQSQDFLCSQLPKHLTAATATGFVPTFERGAASRVLQLQRHAHAVPRVSRVCRRIQLRWRHVRGLLCTAPRVNVPLHISKPDSRGGRYMCAVQAGQPGLTAGAWSTGCGPWQQGCAAAGAAGRARAHLL